MARKKKSKTRSIMKTLLFIYLLPFVAAALMVLTTTGLVLIYGD